MPLKAAKTKTRARVAKQSTGAATAGKAPVARGSTRTRLGAGLALPHERDESTNSAAVVPDPVIAQAKRDIDAGMVDTDMRATPGLDAELRAKLVPGPGGKPPGAGI